MGQLRVLVIDDSSVFRTIIASCVDGTGIARVVAHARNGQEGLDVLAKCSPDVVTLDLEMPVLDGIETLTRIRAQYPTVSVVMISAHTQSGAAMTVRALELGAYDFVAKPNGSSAQENRELLQWHIHALVRQLAAKKAGRDGAPPSSSPIRAISDPAVRKVAAAAPRGAATRPVGTEVGNSSVARRERGEGAASSSSSHMPRADDGPLSSRTASVDTSYRSSTRISVAQPVVDVVRPAGRSLGRAQPPQIVVIGASTGGPIALAHIIPKLPAWLPVPVVVVQHMPPMFTSSLAKSLAEKSAVRVVEAEHGMMLEAGTVFIAPGGAHLRIGELSLTARRIELTDDPPENYCRPAVDYTFRSVASVFGERLLAVILTGMGRDGTEGLKVMKREAVTVIGQSEESCTVYGMPREAKLAGLVDIELPAEKIASAIMSNLGLPS